MKSEHNKFKAKNFIEKAFCLDIFDRCALYNYVCSVKIFNLYHHLVNSFFRASKHNHCTLIYLCQNWCNLPFSLLLIKCLSLWNICKLWYGFCWFSLSISLAACHWKSKVWAVYSWTWKRRTSFTLAYQLNCS